jgi:uncharacterized membrane protein
MTTTPKTRASPSPLLLLGVAYPVAAHLAVLSGRPGLIVASVGLLAALVLFPPLRRGRWWAWCLLAAAACGLLALARSGAATLPLFVPPVLLNGFMAWVFGHTLRPGSVPLIERLVRALHETDEIDDAAIVRYARRLTWAWAVLLGALALVNLVLALCAAPDGILLALGVRPPVTVPLEAWSLFANVLNYLILGAFFVGEYLFRQRVFPQQGYRNIVDFTQRVARLGALFRPSSTEAAVRRSGTD